MSGFQFRILLVVALMRLTFSCLFAGEVYFTNFENFAVGNDKIINTDSWVGTYAGRNLHGVMSESQHLIGGIGNAAVIGGIATAVPKAGTSPTSVYVRRPVNIDPVVLNEEVATFKTNFLILDSSSTSGRRDNFEFLIYNSNLSLLGGIRFDNTTMDSSTGLPRRLIYRLSWNGSAFQYFLTDEIFLPAIMETLQIRINFRTNRWTATLSDYPVFQDLAFYTGTVPRNLGSVMARMVVTNTDATNILPGNNYMLFDNYSVRTDPLSMTATVIKTATGGARITWNEEAGYTYQLQYSNDCVSWYSDLPGASRTATVTQFVNFTDPTTVVPKRRFYRVRRTYP
jgi:hypothetical protein